VAGQSEWHRAAAEGDVMQITDRLEAGQDIDARDRFGQTALMLAARLGRDAVVDRLIEGGAALDVSAKYGLSALMLAVVNQHAKIARRLAAAGADRSLRATGTAGFHGQTAAALARKSGQLELARILAPDDPG
jgi:ankyrin repeat protein